MITKDKTYQTKELNVQSLFSLQSKKEECVFFYPFDSLPAVTKIYKWIRLSKWITLSKTEDARYYYLIYAKQSGTNGKLRASQKNPDYINIVDRASREHK